MDKKIFILASYANSLINFRGVLLKTLLKLGYDVHVAAPDVKAELQNELASWGCVVHQVPMARTGLNPFSDLRCLWYLTRLIKDTKPDIFIGYTIKPVIFGNLAAWLAGVKTRCALITGLGSAFSSDVSGPMHFVVAIVPVLYKLGLSRATHVLFQNPDDLALFQQKKLVDVTKCRVVNGSGVDLNHYALCPLPDQPVFLYIGRLLSDKGIVEYAEAARIVKNRFPSARFLVAGWFDLNPAAISQEQLDEWIASDVIEYLGKLDDVRPAIEQCSAYVFPSYREGTPRTVLEAMSMGRPIITTDSPGCRETVVDGKNGYLVPVRHVNQLVDAVIKLLENSQLRTQMGVESRLLAEDKYDVHKVNQVILEFLGIGSKIKTHRPLSAIRQGQKKNRA